jgi:hypothetical protein
VADLARRRDDFLVDLLAVLERHRPLLQPADG